MGKQKRVLVTGAGGFIGRHLVKRLKSDGHWVRGVDIKHPEYEATASDAFEILDLARAVHTNKRAGEEEQRRRGNEGARRPRPLHRRIFGVAAAMLMCERLNIPSYGALTLLMNTLGSTQT